MTDPTPTASNGASATTRNGRRWSWTATRIVAVSIVLIVVAIPLYKSTALGLEEVFTFLPDVRLWLSPERLQKVFVFSTVALVIGVAGISAWAIAGMKGSVARISALIAPRAALDDVLARINSAARTPEDESKAVRDLVSVVRTAGQNETDRNVRQRLDRVAWALSGCEQEPGNAARSLEMLQPLPHSDVSVRPFVQLCVTGLLFLGIIGTFSGLIGVFGSDLFGQMLVGKKGADIKQPLDTLLSHFQLSFGASLIAYITYLGGRYALDEMDQERSDQLVLIDYDLVGRMKAILSLLQVHVRLDLPASTKQSIVDATQSISVATLKNKETIDALTSISAGLTAASSSLARSVVKIGQSSNVIVRSVESGRETWQKTQTEWATTTKGFGDNVAKWMEQGTAQLDSLVQAREALSATTKDIVEAWMASVKKLVDQMEAEAQRIQKTWDDYILQMIPRLAGAHAESMGVLSRSHAALKESLEDFDKVRQTSSEAAELVRKGQDQIAVALTSLAQSTQATLGDIHGTWAGTFTRLEASLAPSAGALLMAEQRLNQLQEIATRLDALLGGQGTEGRSMVDLLQDLHTLLQATVRGPSMAGRRTAGPVQ